MRSLNGQRYQQQKCFYAITRVTQIFLPLYSVWFYEEQKHSLALMEYLRRFMRANYGTAVTSVSIFLEK